MFERIIGLKILGKLMIIIDSFPRENATMAINIIISWVFEKKFFMNNVGNYMSSIPNKQSKINKCLKFCNRINNFLWIIWAVTNPTPNTCSKMYVLSKSNLLWKNKQYVTRKLIQKTKNAQAHKAISGKRGKINNIYKEKIKL